MLGRPPSFFINVLGQPFPPGDAPCARGYITAGWNCASLAGSWVAAPAPEFTQIYSIASVVSTNQGGIS